MQLMQLISELPVTSIVAIHDPNHAAMFCDSLIVMQQGQILASGRRRRFCPEGLLWDVFRVKTKIEISPYHGKKAHSFHRLKLGGYALFLPAPLRQPSGLRCYWEASSFLILAFTRSFLSSPSSCATTMLLSGGLIGLILGLRTFSQQGMFILGGTLADRHGAKTIILAGCVVRVAGFLPAGVRGVAVARIISPAPA